MAEVVSIHVGGCGNNLSRVMWKVLCEEHGIAPDSQFCGTEPGKQLDKINAFFHEKAPMSYRPRAVLVDTEPNSLELCRNAQYGSLFVPDNLVVNPLDWERGYYREGTPFCQSTMEAVRKETEMCDALQGFMLVHAIGGATGGRLGSSLLLELSQAYPKRILSTQSVTSSLKMTAIIQESHHAILTLKSLIKHADLCFLFDNVALDEICSETFKIKDPGPEDMNKVLAGTISGITAFLRFSCLPNTNGNLHQIVHNSVPFPILHFLNTAVGPIVFDADKIVPPREEVQNMQAAFNPLSQMTTVRPRKGRFLNLSCLFRGRPIPSDLQLRGHVVETVQAAICSIPPTGLKQSACFVSNHTGIRSTLKRILSESRIYFEKGCRLGRFHSAGVEAEEFEEAYTRTASVNLEYASFRK